MKKRFVSLMLALVMVFSLVPMTVQAEETLQREKLPQQIQAPVEAQNIGQTVEPAAQEPVQPKQEGAILSSACVGSDSGITLAADDAVEVTVLGMQMYSYSEDVVELYNELRADYGVSALNHNEMLNAYAMQLAAEYALYMDSDTYNRPNDETWYGDLSIEYGYVRAAWGFDTPEELVEVWTDDEDGLNVVIDAEHTDVGVGCFYTGNLYFFVQIIGYGVGSSESYASQADAMTQVKVDINPSYLNQSPTGTKSLDLAVNGNYSFTITNDCVYNSSWTSTTVLVPQIQTLTDSSGNTVATASVNSQTGEVTVTRKGYSGGTMSFPVYSGQSGGYKITLNALEEPKDDVPANTVQVTVAGEKMYAYSAEVVDQLNAVRTENGLAKLNNNATLTEYAMQLAAEFALYENPDDSWLRPDGTDCWSVFGAEQDTWGGYVGRLYYYTSPQDAAAVWSNSDNLEVLLDSSYTQIGVGCFYTGSEYMWIRLIGTDLSDNSKVTEKNNVMTQVEVNVDPDCLNIWPNGEDECGLAVGDCYQFELENYNSENAVITRLIPDYQNLKDASGNTIAAVSVSDEYPGLMFITRNTAGSGTLSFPVYAGQENAFEVTLGEPAKEVTVFGTVKYSYANEAVQLINEYREENDLDAYSHNAVLNELATQLAAEIALYVNSGWDRPDLTSVETILAQYRVGYYADYVRWSISNTPEEYVEGLLEYVPEYITNSYMTQIGISCFTTNGASVWFAIFDEDMPDNTTVSAKADTTAQIKVNVVPSLLEDLAPIGGPKPNLAVGESYILPIFTSTNHYVDNQLSPLDAQLIPQWEIPTDSKGNPIAEVTVDSQTGEIIITRKSTAGGVLSFPVYEGQPNPYTVELAEISGSGGGSGVTHNPFVDVKQSDYFYKPVLWAVDNGITGGVSANQFGPGQSCTRGQVVTFLWAAAGKPEPTSTANPFTDVKSSDYYYKAVLWAVENGITGGVSATKFGPNQVCTRGQVVTFLWAAENKPEPSSSVNPFTDVKSSDYYYKAVLWAVENGITGGISATRFGPSQNCTRGQVVTFLWAAAGKPEP